ncbi:hypothetical protein C8R45DRAFT_944524 [Mycena sanguinolenta]|nr:hypothetical protein C8R45DRAFT_944524 [Mycena sanguinolenta]
MSGTASGTFTALLSYLVHLQGKKTLLKPDSNDSNQSSKRLFKSPDDARTSWVIDYYDTDYGQNEVFNKMIFIWRSRRSALAGANRERGVERPGEVAFSGNRERGAALENGGMKHVVSRPGIDRREREKDVLVSSHTNQEKGLAPLAAPSARLFVFRGSEINCTAVLENKRTSKSLAVLMTGWSC